MTEDEMLSEMERIDAHLDILWKAKIELDEVIRDLRVRNAVLVRLVAERGKMLGRQNLGLQESA